jgi:hypothetical protein
MPIDKSWQPFSNTDLKSIPGTVGVYELADANGQTVFIGRAGAIEPFGLRGAIARHFSSEETNPVIQKDARAFRYQVTSQYMTRHQELLILHREEFGDVPAGNARGDQLPMTLGRFHTRPSTGQWQQ